MQRFDVATIAVANPIEEVIARHVALKRNGREFVTLCPFHSEKTPSFQVIPQAADRSGKGFFHCKGCGVHGDQFDFLIQYLGVTFPQACEILGGTRTAPGPIVRPAPVTAAPDPCASLVARPAPDSSVLPGSLLECWNAKRANDDPPRPLCRLRPTMAFEYCDPLGFRLGYVLRCEMPDGKKWTPQIRWALCPDGRERWALWSFPEPRPLYQLDKLTLAQGLIWIVEGEKSADAATALLGELAMTWPGGTNGVSHADWSALKGRDVHLWGDADQEGWNAITGWPERNGCPARPGVASLVSAAGANIVSVIAWDQTKPRGWDAGDAIKEMTAVEARSWLRRQSVPGNEILEFAPRSRGGMKAA